MRPRHTLLIALLLILAGDVLAWAVQTGGGRIQVQDIRWVGASGTGMSGLLYVPPGVTASEPAPGILAVHGYINSRETQDGFAIEFARRGFVVLAIDQTGHGYSDPPAFRNGFGGPDGLAYLRSLDFVDKDNIGLEGHSMGGWAILIAAAAAPDDYRAVVIEGSSTGSSGAPDATADYPRNLAVVFFMGGTLAIPSESLWSIIAFQFLPLMTIVGLLTAYFQRMTGHVYVGAFLSGMLVTWIVVASQATHFGG